MTGCLSLKDKLLSANLPPTRSHPCLSMKQSSFLTWLLLGTQFFSFRFFNSCVNDSPCTVLMTTCSASWKLATLIDLQGLTLSRDLVPGFYIRFLSSQEKTKLKTDCYDSCKFAPIWNSFEYCVLFMTWCQKTETFLTSGCYRGSWLIRTSRLKTRVPK